MERCWTFDGRIRILFSFLKTHKHSSWAFDSDWGIYEFSHFKYNVLQMSLSCWNSKQSCFHKMIAKRKTVNDCEIINILIFSEVRNGKTVPHTIWHLVNRFHQSQNDLLTVATHLLWISELIVIWPQNCWNVQRFFIDNLWKKSLVQRTKSG